MRFKTQPYPSLGPSQWVEALPQSRLVRETSRRPRPSHQAPQPSSRSQAPRPETSPPLLANPALEAGGWQWGENKKTIELHVRAADGHDDDGGDDPPRPTADEPPHAHLLRSAHLTPLHCDFQLSSTTARRAPPPPQMCVASRLWPSGAKLVNSLSQSLINYHQL